jgi:hypothetical protein
MRYGVRKKSYEWSHHCAKFIALATLLLGTGQAASTIGACSKSGGTLGTNLFDNDGSFGTLTGTPANPTWASALAAGRTTLKYINKTIRTSPWAGSPEDGEYTISNTTAYRTDGAWWNFTDHTGSSSGTPTGNLNGLMMVINASVTADTFYQQTLTVTPNTNYEYGLWIMNMLKSNSNNPNIQVEVDRIVGGVTLPTQIVAVTGTIAPSNPATWQAFGSVINSGPATQMVVRFKNKNPGGGGNDLAIDDLVFTTCTGLNIGSLSGTVYLDTNRDSVLQAATDTAQAGVTVQLVNAAGIVTTSAVTNSAGYYAFYNVPAATYTVRVQPSDPNINATYVATAPTGAQRTGVVVSSGAFVLNQDFGYQQGVDVQALKTQRLGTTGSFSSAALTSVPRTQFVQYQLTLKNNGTVATTTPSTLTDVLSSSFSTPTIAVAAAAVGGATGCAASFGTGSSSKTLTMTAATLPVGASCVVTIQVQASTAAALSNTATASPPSGIPDYATTNNTATVSTTVLGSPVVVLIKRVRNLGPASALNTSAVFGMTISGKPNDVTEYCINYSNGAGVLNAPGFVLTDALPTNTTAWTDGYGAGKGLQWVNTVAGTTTTTLLTSATTSAASAPSPDDAGELNSTATLRVGTLNSGDSGSMCFRALIR